MMHHDTSSERIIGHPEVSNKRRSGKSDVTVKLALMLGRTPRSAADAHVGLLTHQR